MLVFADGKKESIDNILEVFKEFAGASGLNISLEKSTIYLAGIEDRDRESILEQFRFDSGYLPVRYLGLPLLTKRMTVSDYTPLIEKVRSRISSWTARHLSFAGRLQLIGSVIHSLTNFWISAFRLPKACITEIDKLCGAFLWSGPDLNPKKAKIAWKEVCKPKEEGGLGLRSISEANIVSCLKLLWKIISDRTSLWVRWIHRFLIRKGSFWSVNMKSNQGSWIWRKLLQLRPIASEFVKVEIKSGSEASFWYDAWSPLGCLMELTGLRGCIDLGIARDATVEQALNTHRRRRHRLEILNKVEQEIQNLRDNNHTDESDIWLWKKKSDIYSHVFSSKATLTAIRQAQPSVSWHKGVWFAMSTPKYSVFTWLATLNRLSTNDRAMIWNNQLDPTCILCNNHVESRDHLFFSCIFSEEVWKHLAQGLFQSRYTANWSQIMEILVDSTMGKTRLYLCRYSLQITAYSLWHERNKCKHGEAPQNPMSLIRFIDKQIRNRISSVAHNRLPDAMQMWFAVRS